MFYLNYYIYTVSIILSLLVQVISTDFLAEMSIVCCVWLLLLLLSFVALNSDL